MIQTPATTETQDAMLERLAYLVYVERRSASWQDFAQFEVDGKLFRLAQGTIRNNFSYLKRIGKIELEYRSINSYYTLPGETSAKRKNAMTSDHTSVTSRRDVIRPVYDSPLAALIGRMPFDTPAVHDIRLRFNVPGIYNILSPLTFIRASYAHIASNKTITVVASSDGRNNHKQWGQKENEEQTTRQQQQLLELRKRSKDLVAPMMLLSSGIKGFTTLHKTDVVSVILSCSQKPIRFDPGGLMRLSTCLGQIEGRLASLIDEAVKNWQQQYQSSEYRQEQQQHQLVVPEPESWIVTMWHIGRDSLQSYAGKRFEISWQDVQGNLIRAYSKQIMENLQPQKLQPARISKRRRSYYHVPAATTTIRLEKQEYPKISLSDAVEQKLALVTK